MIDRSREESLPVRDTRGVQAVVLDVEGTTTPIAFVYDVLFPFARTHLRPYLEATSHDEGVIAILARLEEERHQDTERGDTPPASMPDYVDWLMDRDRKSPGLKALQGQIWAEGFRAGVLKGEVFGDVRPALERWRDAGLRVAIYSSGSVLAQQLIFGSTADGDLRSLISQFFDTAVGPKGDPDSYRRIAAALSCPVGQLLFVSDVMDEIEAAQAAGCLAVLCVRPGNRPQREGAARVVHSFDELLL